jgi:tetratricopeptide (TPR) repeat protein
MKIRQIVLVVILGITLASPAYAEIKTFTETVKQTFGGSQSPDDARTAAIAKAKRNVLEKAGTYLESLTIVKNSKIDKDDILALSAGILKVEVVSQKNFIEGDAFGIIIETKVDVDTSVLNERVKTMLGDRELMQRYTESQKRETELLAKVKLLEEKNRELEKSNADEKQKAELKKEFKENTQGIEAVEWNQKALTLWKDGKYSDPNKAIEYLNKAIEIDPSYVGAYNNRGIAWCIKGEYDRAIKDFNRAIEIDTFNAYIYVNRGATLGRQGDYDKAIQDYNKAIQIDPKNATAFSGRGDAWSDKGDEDQAINDYTKAIEIDPSDANVYYNRGLSWEMKDEPDIAKNDYTKAIDINPSFSEAYARRGVLWQMEGDYDRAIQDFNHAIEKNQSCISAYINRGSIWSIKGNYDMAIHDDTRAIEIDPTFALAYSNRGMAWIEKGNREKGCRDFKKACDLGYCEGMKFCTHQKKTTNKKSK